MRVAINGLGRIGKCVLRSYFASLELFRDIEIVAVNVGRGSIESRMHSLKYDSTHGTFDKSIAIVSETEVLIDGKYNIKLLFERRVEHINWAELDVAVVLECTGSFNDAEAARQHLNSGAKKVIVSAPCAGADATIILGANEDSLDVNKHHVISIGSCTTNCLAPLAKVLHRAVGIESGFMTTIHAYTNDQLLLDGYHKDKRRARAAALSIVPTMTGAARSIGLVLPELDGKIDGAAVRVPVANVSMIDFKFISRIKTSAEIINERMKSAAVENCSVLGVSEEELVSCDFNHTSYSAVFDLSLTRVVNSNLCRVVAWYDNEWGFSNRMLEVTSMFAKAAL